MARILVVDDEPAVRELLRQILEGAGHQVFEAANGKVAMVRLAKQPADLVIVDMLMPEKDGVEVIIEVKEQYPDLGIIAVSGGGRGLDAGFNLMVAQDFGAHRTLGKPFTRQQVLELVGEMLVS